jgi:hypothetical protein
MPLIPRLGDYPAGSMMSALQYSTEDDADYLSGYTASPQSLVPRENRFSGLGSVASFGLRLNSHCCSGE